MRTFWITAALATTAGIVGSVLTELLTQRIAIVGAFAGLQKSYNPGIAFGLRLPERIQELLILAALVVVGWMAFTSARTRLSQTAFGLIIGGGLANIIDRVPDGLVTDVFQVGTFPVFNVADSCITIGVVLLFVEVVRKGRQKHG